LFKSTVKFGNTEVNQYAEENFLS